MKMVKRRKKAAGLKRLIEEKKTENTQLENELRELRANVLERQRILKIQTSRTVDDGGPEKKFRRTSQMRKLRDVLAAQESEVKYLAEEVDRLRKRTFPSFGPPSSLI
eukprot:GCRY01006390.1.p1 GENE.GCRY01006390.1~~GCRY01006390.1.p1  ORF type:complete len:108 (+),score=36.95 GCRY01006390.1:2-325(+)